MANLITTPMIGASLTTIWSPPYGVAAGSTGADATAPFALGTPALGMSGANTAHPKPIEAQFCRLASEFAPGATGGITDGVTTTGATGNSWANVSGATGATGDYMFLAAAVTVNP